MYQYHRDMIQLYIRWYIVVLAECNLCNSTMKGLYQFIASLKYNIPTVRTAAWKYHTPMQLIKF